MSGFSHPALDRDEASSLRMPPALRLRRVVIAVTTGRVIDPALEIQTRAQRRQELLGARQRPCPGLKATVLLGQLDQLGGALGACG
jgi:hypothetical protein